MKQSYRTTGPLFDPPLLARLLLTALVALLPGPTYQARLFVPWSAILYRQNRH